MIAVGTTVVRALETVDRRARHRPRGQGLDEPRRDPRATPWPSSTASSPAGTSPTLSHLLMLEAIAGRRLLERSYAAALDHGYRWHEFGDVHLILP